MFKVGLLSEFTAINNILKLASLNYMAIYMWVSSVAGEIGRALG